MQLIKDIWTWVKEWNEWKMKDWIKSAVIVVIVLIVLKVLIIGG